MTSAWWGTICEKDAAFCLVFFVPRKKVKGINFCWVVGKSSPTTCRLSSCVVQTFSYAVCRICCSFGRVLRAECEPGSHLAHGQQRHGTAAGDRMQWFRGARAASRNDHPDTLVPGSRSSVIKDPSRGEIGALSYIVLVRPLKSNML